MIKRITFSAADAAHLYELAHDNFQPDCYDCQKTKQRLESFLGEKTVKSIKKTLEVNLYNV